MKAEKALRASEQKFLSFVASAPVGIFHSDLNGATVYVNDTWSTFAGMSASEALGEGWISAIHPADRELTLESWRGFLRGEADYKREQRYQWKNGTVRYGYVQMAPESLETGEVMGYIGTITDITEQSLHRNALKAVFDNAPVELYLKDLEGRYLQINRRFEELFDVKNEDLVGKLPDNAHEPGLAERSRQHDLSVLKTGEVLIREEKATTKYGDRILNTIKFPIFDGQKNITGLGAVVSDITEQKQATKSLEQSHSIQDAILSNIDQGLSMADANGAIIAYNKRFLEINNFPPSLFETECKYEDIVRFNAERGHYGPGEISELIARRLERLNSSEPSVEEKVLSDGRILKIRLQPLPNGSVVITDTDITERKVAERQKDEFIALISHELRTPLTSIMGSLRLIQSGVLDDLPDKRKSMIAVAHDNSKRLLKLINDILDIEKFIAGEVGLQMKPTKIVSLIEDAIKANKGYGEKYGITFVKTAMEKETLVYGDKDRLMQVLANLMSNAAKFSHEGEQVELSVTRNGDTIRIAVKNKGPGIPEAMREKVFEKFTQVDSSDIRQVGGTGLGLNITKAIVEQHGGTIDFVSEVGINCTFFFTLPILE